MRDLWWVFFPLFPGWAFLALGSTHSGPFFFFVFFCERERERPCVFMCWVKGSWASYMGRVVTVCKILI